MQVIPKAKYLILLTLSLANSASACVSMGASHTCNKDCSSWSSPWYEICVYGGKKGVDTSQKGESKNIKTQLLLPKQVKEQS